MKFGVATFFTGEGIGPAALAEALEERGFDSLFVTEHTHIPASRRTPYPIGGELPDKYYRLLDPFLALTAAATVTRTLLLGTGVALIAQRDPIITAKEVATLDQLSNGRFLFGVGIGWNREEMESHGTDPKTRGKLADERLEAMQAIWTREIAEYHGKLVDFDPLYVWPKPVQRPHPPLYFGGGPAAFPRIARFGGGWYAVSPSSDELAASAAQLRAVTGTESRITAAHVGPVTEEALRGYADSGAERVVFDLETMSDAETLTRLDEYAALAHSLGWSRATPAPTEERGPASSASRPQHRIWRDIPPTPLGDFGDRITFKALTADVAQVLLVEIAAGTSIPNQDDPSEQEVHLMEQIDVIISGRIKYVVDGRELTMGPGEALGIPSGVPHSAVTLEDTTMIEVFTPVPDFATNEIRTP
jgi:probable F420-dependent oxidoreductase